MTYTELLAKHHNDRIVAQKSTGWFASQVRTLTGKITPTMALRQAATQPKTLVNQPRIGFMYLYGYDPKTKDTLPYFDRFPLVLPFAPAEGGFMGLNLHYIPHQMRAQLLDRLLAYRNNDRMDETTKIQLSYELLSNTAKLKMFEPCVKRYLSSHVMTRYMQIPARDWFTVIMMPLERFVGASAATVHRESVKRIRNG
jgi:hypothetical protein